MKEKLLIKLILFRQDKVEKIIIIIIIKVKLILFGQDKVEKIIIIIIIKVKLILFGQDKVEKKNEDGKIAKDSRFN